MNTKHSEPFYISSNLFDNRRLKRRLCKWMERLRERQQLYMAQMRSHGPVPAFKTERGKRRCPPTFPRRHVAATLPADITIDLLSDDDDDDDIKDMIQRTASTTAPSMATSELFLHTRPAHASLQLSTMPNITLIPVPVPMPMAVPVSVKLTPAHSSSMLLMPASRASSTPNHCSRLASPRKRYGDVTSTTTHTSTLGESIVLTSDEEDNKLEWSKRRTMRSPPPLAPLTYSETVEEVTVSLVPRNSTTANCQARQRRRQPRDVAYANSHSSTSPKSHHNGYLKVDVANDVTASLPDETTVHTVIANRIYELSLSKLREGLASSGVTEYAHDLLPEQLQKLSPAMRAKVAPMVAPSPPAPISLKLSSDLSISLISDDDDCEAGNTSGGKCADQLHPVAAAEAHAAAKLLQQQQPQLSVVQHLQYPGHGTPVALPVAALAATPPTLTAPSTRRRKLG